MNTTNYSSRLRPVPAAKPTSASGPKKTSTGAHPDQKYITALLTNNAALLDELYQKYSPKIKGMILQNNGTETDAADILQEALVCIFHKAKTQQFILTCPLDAFLYRICKNKWLNELNKRKLHKVKLYDPALDNTIGDDCFKLTEECLLLQARNKLLMETVSKMSIKNQQLLHLSWSNKTMEEVAQKLKVSYGYVRKKKSECMAKLVKLVKQSPEYTTLQW